MNTPLAAVALIVAPDVCASLSLVEAVPIEPLFAVSVTVPTSNNESELAMVISPVAVKLVVPLLFFTVPEISIGAFEVTFSVPVSEPIKRMSTARSARTS